jgi:hypothetical protein
MIYRSENSGRAEISAVIWNQNMSNSRTSDGMFRDTDDSELTDSDSMGDLEA